MSIRKKQWHSSCFCQSVVGFYSLIVLFLFSISKVETTWKFESLLRREKHADLKSLSQPKLVCKIGLEDYYTLSMKTYGNAGRKEYTR